MKAKGLPRLTVIERYMRGDEEIKNLYNFSQHLYPYLQHIDSEKFKFTSEKFITPDRICFDFGNRWDFTQLNVLKYVDEDWKKDTVEVGETIFIPVKLLTPFCENIQFIYNNGRKETICDKVYDVIRNNIKKADVVDDVAITILDKDNLGIEMYNTMLVGRQFNNLEETDTMICDWWKPII